MEYIPVMSTTERIQEAVRRDGRPLKTIGEAARVDVSQLCRFMKNQRGLTLASADRLCAALGAELRLVRPRPNKRR